MSKNKKDTKQKKGGSRTYRVLYAIFAGIFRFFFNYKVIDRHKERDKGSFIVSANHVSATDPIALCYAFRKNQVCFMAKKEIFKIPVLAQLIKLMGAFPIDRGGNDVGAIKKAVGLIENGGCLGIFPQGHRYPEQDPRQTPTKNGMALIATKAHADIYPAYIWRKDNKFRIFRKTYIIIGDVIPFDSLGFDPSAPGEYTRITNLVFDKICSLGEQFKG